MTSRKRLTRAINIRVLPEDLKQLRQLADSRRISLGCLIRDALHGEISREAIVCSACNGTGRKP
jgi:predicted HicB family RNase H-like nuclease